jgi:hypothetical protein
MDFSVSKAISTAVNRLLDIPKQWGNGCTEELERSSGNLNVGLAKQAVQRKLLGIIKQIGCVQEYTTVGSMSVARKARVAGSAPGTMRVTKRRVGSSMDKRATM